MIGVIIACLAWPVGHAGDLAAPHLAPLPAAASGLSRGRGRWSRRLSSSRR